MQGSLEIYHPQKRLPCFISTPSSAVSSTCVIFIAGLSDNLFACDHLSPLQQHLAAKKWSLVQPFLQSGHTGCGIASLQSDVEDLDILIEFLQSKKGYDRFILIGYSTGCQDSVEYLRSGRFASKIAAAILQAPVSDREYLMTLPDTARYIALAKQMIQNGDADELMPRSAFFLPITAYRFHALAAVGGDDDKFSSDFTLVEMREKLGHINCPTAVVYGTADEYVPAHVDLKALGERIVSSLGSSASSELHIIEGANHAISGDASHIASFVSFVMKFVEKI
eukprot:TRINITY_DN6201_c0_g1_i1.p1 TRINITY_DN6201_c0_g1~~TRINITY_DN6201_c0_g1_i1.p1  ORF type:complete len:281 (+),score=37.24 TRINITY_DN6201_c0_g1_i1:29-871(+)